jgi:trigger factor
MKYNVQKKPNCIIEVTVEDISEDILKKYETQSLKELAENIKLDGFREGHIPPEVIRKQVGDDKIRIQMIHNALPDIYVKALQENKISPVEQPETSIDGLDPLKITFKITVKPEIKLGDYKKIKIKENPVDINDEEVKETIDNIRKQHQSGKEVGREAKIGDRLEIDFDGKTPDGVVLENTSSKNHPLILGENTLMPDFEKQLVGMKKDETKEFQITFPKDYHAKTMAGKDVVFNVTVKKIEELIPAELTAEFVKKILGEEAEVKNFEAEVKKRLQEQKKIEAQHQKENEFFKELAEITKGDIPESFVSAEQDNILKEFKERLGHQGISFENYLKHIKKDEDGLRNDLRKEAEDRIRIQLALHEIMDKEKIDASDAEMEQEIEKLLERYDKKEHDNIRKIFKQGSQQYNSLKNRFLYGKTVSHILPK